MGKLKNDGIYQIRVTNLVDKSEWNHKRVPANDVCCLMMNKNLAVRVIRMVGVDESIRENDKK